MSAIPPPATPATQTARTNAAISAAQDGITLLNTLQTADPALYAQLVGSVATYSKSSGGTLACGIIAWGAAQWGMACSATVTTNCLTPEATQVLGGVAALAGAFVGSLIMHKIGKLPGQKLTAPTPSQAA